MWIRGSKPFIWLDECFNQSKFMAKGHIRVASDGLKQTHGRWLAVWKPPLREGVKRHSCGGDGSACLLQWVYSVWST